MVKKYGRLIKLMNGLLEYAIFYGSYLIATYIKFDIMYRPNSILEQAWNIPCFIATALYCMVLVISLSIAGHYRAERASLRFTKNAFELIYFNALGVIILYATLYVTRIADFSRLALLYFVIVSSVLILIKRFIIRGIIKEYRSKGFNLRHVVVVGNGKLAKQYIETTQKNKSYGIAVAGYMSKVPKAELGTCLGSYEDLEKVLDMNPGIEQVVVALESHEMSYIPFIIAASDNQGVKVSVIPSYNDYIPTNPEINIVGSTKLINIRMTPLDDPMNKILKRVEDIFASLILILLSSPIMIVVCLGIIISSPGPILFKQERMGRGKKNFTMLKFRSMKVNKESDTAWSSTVDNRRTKFGSWIRKCSLDELPQFFNVLRGDMSLVGPRPEIPFHVEHFKSEIPQYLVRQQVKPGITGWAQVNGLRGDTSIEDRIEYDIWYIENWSLLLDFQIIFKTVFGGMINDEKC